ncbi:hypothetical protein [Paenibacillus protaetiae]|uniref:DUF4309 domain-containing protein n=1 Tax=Paenibacillus protaetiae TaxID=2509456 RepID=A0A4P6EUK9_9BACL|nr:hypothetical protein [Paenibacillus protaetiae]QAY65329.1 hypothetical protein ET464_01965 [Paenibacillus protaetiae]
MKRIALQHLLIGSSAVLLLAAAGCQSSPRYLPESSVMIGDHEVYPVTDSPQKSYLANVHNEEKGVHATGPGQTPKSGEQEPVSGAAAEQLHPGASDASAWNKDKPALMNIAIGEFFGSLKERFGNPSDSYDLPDGDKTVTVYEYEGYSVGVSSEQHVQFIEIHSSLIPSGIGELQIGSTPEAAIQTLGKPSSQTAYRLTYEAKGASLLLDLDPEAGAVVSLKLLSD